LLYAEYDGPGTEGRGKSEKKHESRRKRF